MTVLTSITAAHARLSANIRGALWMLASALTFTVMTTLIKLLGAHYSPALQTFYRQAAALLIMSPLILRNPVAAFRTTRPGVLLFRASAGTVGLILSFYSFQNMGLAEANALSFTRTLWIVPLAIFVLREKLGPWRIGATLVGFVGVLFMLQPSGGSASIGLPALAGLAAAFLFAFTITSMKVMTRDHSTLVLTAWSQTLGLVFSLPIALFSWRWPTPVDLLLLTAMGGLALINQITYIKGMAIGDAAAMAPIDYTRLIFAVIVGFSFFHEVPSLVVMGGAALVIGSTLVITLRDMRRARPPPPQFE